MPYRSKKQSAMIHAMAAKGVPWAVKWVKENHGANVKALPTYAKKKKGH